MSGTANQACDFLCLKNSVLSSPPVRVCPPRSRRPRRAPPPGCTPGGPSVDVKAYRLLYTQLIRGVMDSFLAISRNRGPIFTLVSPLRQGTLHPWGPESEPVQRKEKEKKHHPIDCLDKQTGKPPLFSPRLPKSMIQSTKWEFPSQNRQPRNCLISGFASV